MQRKWRSANNMAQNTRKFDEEAAIEAAFERGAVPRLRSVLEVERERVVKGHKPDIALEKWGPQIEEEILRDIEAGN